MLVMRKVFVVIIASIILMSVACSAETTNEDASVFFLELYLGNMKDETGKYNVIDYDNSFAFVGNDGNVYVVLRTTISHLLFPVDEKDAVNTVAALWKLFNAIHSELSDKELALSLVDTDSVIMYMAQENLIRNSIKGVNYDFPEINTN